MKYRIAVLILACGFGPSCPGQNVPASGEAADSQNPAPTEINDADAALSEVQPSPLSALTWLTGTWVNTSPNARVSFKIETIGADRFLRNQFTVESDGVTGLRGVQVIGWDPIAQSVRSWSFDSEGGFGEASWSRKDGRWKANTTFTRQDGSIATAINVFEKQDENHFTWKSVSREIDGALQPTIPATQFVRQIEPAIQAEQPEGAQTHGQ